ncbi:rod shape-determining protein MreC [Puniceicoccaceae bacterium K14]|nr:rod shape-determining protein MreC [Puniceicoccaceae bacterium K14]
MAKKRLFYYRPLLILSATLFAWLILPVFIKSLLKTSFYEFQAPVSVGASYMGNLQDYWASKTHSKKDLFEAGQNLARLNAGYELAIVENNALKGEITRLENLLQLPSRPNYRYEIARVVSRDFNSWWQRIEIRKGSIHGIRRGDAVVFTGGVVGRVSEVGRSTAIIDLLSNGRLRMAAIIEGDNRPMSFRGAGAKTFASPNGFAEFVPSDVKITDPERPPRLITSGMGGIFPPGLHIGYITKLTPGANGMFNDADIQLDNRLMGISEVAVLIPLNPRNE